jgi:fumarylpyruvate hydrolase
MTRRDLQFKARDMGRPWDFGKSFDDSAPITPIHPVASSGHHSKGRIWLKVNDETRQEADLGDMIWNVPETIAFLSGYYLLRPGDLIFTGTPAGVGAVKRGDRLLGGVEGLPDLPVTIV